jgi:superfamily II DNA or RNA helicase
MLQSLISKDYHQDIFDGFGLTIIDEVHHISSQTFSNALFKVITKFMLGLSATMDRKDGTTKVFKMFLGEIIHKVERTTSDNVEVRALTYKTNDDEFNDTILDYRGNPQISSMISKLCEYNRRTEFIIQTLCDFITTDNVDKNIVGQHKIVMDNSVSNCEICIKNNNYLIKNTCCDAIKYCMPCMEEIISHYEKNVKKERPKCPNCKKVLKYEQNYIENPYIKPIEQTHTIVMAHNLNILHYIYKKFVCKNLASVGYYVGGMSEIDLKKSEKKQVILASFSMCSEGLDIPTLNAEFLITPKTDIVQIVGRILRAKHLNAKPIVYDFVDTHDLFQKQWSKRKAYYKKQNYKIIGTDNLEYNIKFNEWKEIYNPKCIFTKKNSLSKKYIKNISTKSNSSTDKSITSESDDSENETELIKDKYACGICLLKIKK